MKALNSVLKCLGLVIVLLSAVNALKSAYRARQPYSENISRSELKRHGVIIW